jgi:F420-non-reducing hydrogenase iron-sulfur subunit
MAIATKEVTATKQGDRFEPSIVGFLCRWCSYTGADLAGTSRIKYPPNLIPIRVMCSGRVDPTFVIKAFAEGADGVLIAGCHMGDCHYINGNHKTLRRYPLLLKMLAQFGIEKERVRLEWVSASEGERFGEVVGQITEDVRKLGPFKRAHLVDIKVDGSAGEVDNSHG